MRCSQRRRARSFLRAIELWKSAHRSATLEAIATHHATHPAHGARAVLLRRRWDVLAATEARKNLDVSGPQIFPEGASSCILRAVRRCRARRSSMFSPSTSAEKAMAA